MLKLLLSLFFLIITIFSACKSNNCACTDSAYTLSNDSLFRQLKVDSGSLNTSEFASYFANQDRDSRFGIHFLNRKNSIYLIIMGKSDTLNFIDIFDPGKSIKKYTGDFFHGMRDDYCLNLLNDTLHLINNRTFIYNQFSIDSNLNLQKILSFDLKEIIDFKNLFINGDLYIDKRILFVNPYLLIPYGHFRKKNNADKTALFSVNIVAKKMSRCLTYPERYRNCDTRVPYLSLEPVKPGSLIAVFQKSDRLYKIDPFSTRIDTASATFINNFMCYNKKLVSNLSYTQKIDLNDENNVNIIFSDPFFYLVKQLRRNSRFESLRGSILVFNKTLDYLGSFTPSEHLSPRISFEYKNGIAIFNDSLTRIYHYVFKEKK